MKLNATISCLDVLHFRPLTILGKMCSLFPRTSFNVRRRNPISAEAGRSADPKNILTMLLPCFADSEEVEIEATGELSDLAAILLKSGLENMRLLENEISKDRTELELRTKIYELIRRTLEREEIPGTERLLQKARSIFLKASLDEQGIPRTSYEAATILGARLHNAIVDILPFIAEYFESVLVLSLYSEQEKRDMLFDLSSSKDSWSHFSLLAASPPAGTHVTIRTSGHKAEDCSKYVAYVLRLLPTVDDWIRNEGLYMSSKRQMIEGVLDLMEKCVYKAAGPHTSTDARHPVLHDLLTSDRIILKRGQSSKEEALHALVSLHEKQTGVPADIVLQQVYLRELHLPCFENGIAIPHARVETGPLVSLCLGVYKKGIPWVGHNRAYIVLLLVTAADAVQSHIGYLGQACRVLGNEEGLRSLLEADSKEQILAELRVAEARIGSPLPVITKMKVIVVESIADEITLARDRMINESPRMEGIHVEYLYACTQNENGSLAFDGKGFERSLRSRIYKTKPDFVLLHTGIAFFRYKHDLFESLKMIRKEFPEVRIGYQEKPGLSIDQDIFDNDTETLSLQRKFFQGLLGGHLS